MNHTLSEIHMTHANKGLASLASLGPAKGVAGARRALPRMADRHRYMPLSPLLFPLLPHASRPCQCRSFLILSRAAPRMDIVSLISLSNLSLSDRRLARKFTPPTCLAKDPLSYRKGSFDALAVMRALEPVVTVQGETPRCGARNANTRLLQFFRVAVY